MVMTLMMSIRSSVLQKYSQSSYQYFWVRYLLSCCDDGQRQVRELEPEKKGGEKRWRNEKSGRTENQEVVQHHSTPKPEGSIFGSKPSHDNLRESAVVLPQFEE